MRTRLLLALCLAISSLPLRGEVALACSVGPGWDPVAATQVFVVGRIAEIDVRRPQREGLASATVTLELEAVLKGTAPAPVRFVDAGSAFVARLPGGVERVDFGGSGGACGALDGRPLGRYLAIALARDADGTLRSSLLFGVAQGSSARDPRLRWVLQRHGLAVPEVLRRADADAGQRLRFWARADYELRIVNAP